MADGDAPKTLASSDECARRIALLGSSHMRPLAQLVEEMRRVKGKGYAIPHFDPLDGGVDAEVLFLMEAPGPKAVATGFVSRNNPDETAKNMFLLNAEAGLDRRRTAVWNAVPWYIGTGIKIRPARQADVAEADQYLAALLDLMHRLQLVAFVGRKAMHAQHVVEHRRPDAALGFMPHPSPVFVNRAPGNRAQILAALQAFAARLGSCQGGA